MCGTSGEAEAARAANRTPPTVNPLFLYGEGHHGWRRRDSQEFSGDNALELVCRGFDQCLKCAFVCDAEYSGRYPSLLVKDQRGGYGLRWDMGA